MLTEIKWVTGDVTMSDYSHEYFTKSVHKIKMNGEVIYVLCMGCLYRCYMPTAFHKQILGYFENIEDAWNFEVTERQIAYGNECIAESQKGDFNGK